MLFWTAVELDTPFISRAVSKLLKLKNVPIVINGRKAKHLMNLNATLRSKEEKKLDLNIRNCIGC